MAVVLREEDITPSAADFASARDGIDLGGVENCSTDYSMDCRKFESALSDYFDGLLAPEEATLFRAHSLQCRACRSLMDDVKAAISACREQDEIETPQLLETTLTAIPAEHQALSCNGFEELVTELLDGFVPAATYHRLEKHTEECNECSTLLTGVVYAVAACHLVHTFEEVDVAEPMLARLIQIMPERRPSLARRVADRIAAFAGQLIPRPTQSARWTFATAASLSFATFALLLFGFSDDGTVAGIYRQAHVKASELYTQGADVYTQTDKVVARLERVGMGIGELWDTLGGETKSQDSPSQNSNKRIDSSDKN